MRDTGLYTCAEVRGDVPVEAVASEPGLKIVYETEEGFVEAQPVISQHKIEVRDENQ